MASTQPDQRLFKWSSDKLASEVLGVGFLLPLEESRRAWPPWPFPTRRPHPWSEIHGKLQRPLEAFRAGDNHLPVGDGVAGQGQAVEYTSVRISKARLVIAWVSITTSFVDGDQPECGGASKKRCIRMTVVECELLDDLRHRAQGGIGHRRPGRPPSFGGVVTALSRRPDRTPVLLVFGSGSHNGRKPQSCDAEPAPCLRSVTGVGRIVQSAEGDRCATVPESGSQCGRAVACCSRSAPGAPLVPKG